MARPLSDRPGARWAVVCVMPYGKEDVLAYGPRRVCEAIAARMQDREDDLHRPPV